jgi:chromosome segregation ATPase
VGDTHIFKSHHDEETAQLRTRIAELEAALRYMTVERDSLTVDRDDLLLEKKQAEAALASERTDHATTTSQLINTEAALAGFLGPDGESPTTRRVAELEAENQLVKADFDRMQREYKHEKIRAEQAEATLENSNERFTSLARRITTFLGADADAREKLLGGLHIDMERAARDEEGSAGG